MSDVLNMQDDNAETPDEEKGSWVSVVVCHASHASIAFCMQK